MTRASLFGLAAFVLLGVTLTDAASAPQASPLSPREEQATFHLPKGFKVELVAAEPNVVDPVAMTFDEDGRMFVVEMRGYPNGGVGEGVPVLPGRIKLLEDRDGDGYFETSSVYADNLRFPTGVTCWRGGLIVADAPDLLYCKNGERKVLYTGFGNKNIQQMVNSLQFHLDNWIYGCNGSNDSVIRSVEKPDAPAVDLRGRNFRFRPDFPASLEPMSGGGQYGLAADDWGNWFTCTNSQHIRHIVLSDHYLKRNPYLAVPAVTHDIADEVDQHTAAAKLFRISPFEPWRVERTTRRAGSADAARFPSTELVPGGYVTSACGLTIYRGGAFPREYDGNAFVCDPANNLIHRDVLVPDGPTFIAKRHDKDCEFLASTDTWFRPVFLCQGPDGAIYVCDFYREVIETPLSLPEDIQKRYNLQSRGRGRIWRIAAANYKATKPPTVGFDWKTAQQIDLDYAKYRLSWFDSENAWARLTAQRLLIEQQPRDQKAVEAIRKRFELIVNPPWCETDASKGMFARWRMDLAKKRLNLHRAFAGSGISDARMDTDQEGDGLPSEIPEVIVETLRGERVANRPNYTKIVLDLANHSSSSVRFQVALTLGDFGKDPRAGAALAKLARKDGANPWHQAAILSSCLPYAPAMLQDLIKHNDVAPAFLGKLAGMAAASGDEAAVNNALVAIVNGDGQPTLRQMLVLDGLAQGLARKSWPLAKRLQEKGDVAERLTAFLRSATEITLSERASLPERLAATRLLAHVPLAIARPTIVKLLAPQLPGELQTAAVQALAAMPDPEVADVLLQSWGVYSPSVRREVQEAIFARADRLPRLLTAIQKNEVQVAQLDLARREQLLKHSNSQIRERAQRLFAGQHPPERKQVIKEHTRVLELSGDPARGKLVFKTNCATCHRLENEGHEVGPDLLSALKTKTKETLLADILDPSREVDPRYLNYIVATKDGRTFTGLIASESASSLTLRRADRAEDSILRADIDAIQSTGKSLMPEGLEKLLDDQQLADVIAYLSVTARK